MHQFIETLKNMQVAAAHMEGKLHHTKKSRALDMLLCMFKNIDDDCLSFGGAATALIDPLVEPFMLEHRVE